MAYTTYSQTARHDETRGLTHNRMEGMMKTNNKMQGGVMQKLYRFSSFSFFSLLRGSISNNCSLTPDPNVPSRKWKTILSGILLLLLPHLAIAQGGKWEVDKQLAGIGQATPLCQALQERLNAFYWKDQGCAWNVISTYPKFSQPPWQKLNAQEHVELIYQIMMYRGRADQYFRRGAGGQLPPIRDTGNRRVATDFIARGGQLLIWRTRLLNFYGDATRPAPPGQQTIIELRESFDDKKALDACQDKPRQQWYGSTYFVTSDLSGPDPNVDAGTAFTLQRGVLLIHEGTTYLVTGEGEVTRMQTSADKTIAWPIRYCGYQFKKGEN
jgi:hypothetical protein